MINTFQNYEYFNFRLLNCLIFTFDFIDRVDWGYLVKHTQGSLMKITLVLYFTFIFDNSKITWYGSRNLFTYFKDTCFT